MPLRLNLYWYCSTGNFSVKIIFVGKDPFTVLLIYPETEFIPIHNQALYSHFKMSFLTSLYIVFLGEVFVGPSDVGGSCPTGTYNYRTSCCCASGCCWGNCRLSNPPDDCLPPGAAWTFTVDEESQDQWEHDGKVGYFQATKIGERTRCMKWASYNLIVFMSPFQSNFTKRKGFRHFH